MKMIPILCIIVVANIMSATSSDFQKQFGPNSAQYNTPLYFTNKNQHKTRDKRPKTSYREQLRQKMRQKKTQEKSAQKTLTQPLDLSDQ